MTLIAVSAPVRVLASGGQDVNHLDERYGGETPDILDNALVIVEYESGVRASLDLCMFAEGSTNQEELAVVGDEGKVEAFLPSGIVREGRRGDGPWGWRRSIPSSKSGRSYWPRFWAERDGGYLALRDQPWVTASDSSSWSSVPLDS